VISCAGCYAVVWSTRQDASSFGAIRALRNTQVVHIAIIGLGTIARHHADALAELEDAEVVAGLDREDGRQLTFRGRRVPVYTDARSLFARERVDVAVVATPVSTHAAVVTEVARRAPCKVVVEKPLAPGLGDVRRLLADDFRCDVQTLLHAAVGPEMNWAVTVLDDLLERHGDIVGFDSFLADGLLSQVERLRASLGDAWIDLGINALSALHRVVSVDSVELELVDPTRETYSAHVTFRSRDTVGRGSLLVSWAGLEPAKHSDFRFADGARLLLDHQAGSGVVTFDNRIEQLIVPDDDQPRLHRHYVELFERLLAHDRVFDRATELYLHEKLFEAMTR
jgi:predicted dehydrogenase